MSRQPRSTKQEAVSEKKMRPNRNTKLSTQVETRSRREPEQEEKYRFDPKDFVSSGSTLLNLALTEHPDCGWQKGKMANIIGDSGAGKTLLTLTSLAEAAHSKNHKDTSLYFDDAENALEFDLAVVFGKKTEERTELITPPSNTIEKFSDNLDAIMKKDSDFIYILDSFDAIRAEDDLKHSEAERKIRIGESNKKSTGSYGTTKPKLASQMLSEICGTLKKTAGALLIISQTRDNLTPGSFEKKTRSGGRALKFYATHEVWVILTGTLRSANKRRIGSECEIKVSKNKVTGKRRSINLNILDGYGIDDIGSMIDFMLDEKEWAGGGSSNINTKGDLGLKEPISKKKLVELIENSKEIERQLKDIVAEVWLQIEEELKPDRRAKYG